MTEQLKDALTTLVVSMFSKKFIAFLAIAYVLYQERQWTELLIAFGTYAGVETADKKLVTKRQPTPPESEFDEYDEDEF